MADLNRKANTAEEMNDQDAARVGGGFLTKDRYSVSQYSQAGVTHDINVVWFDTYYIRGIKIKRKTANAITDYYLKTNKRIPNEVLREKFGVNVRELGK